MGTWSVLDSVSLCRGERELAIARRRVPPLPAGTVWYKRYVGDSIAVPWWQVLAFVGVFGTLVAANALFSPVQLPWRSVASSTTDVSGWLWGAVIGVMLVWMGWRSRPSLRAKARARRARVGPLEDVVRRGRTAETAVRVLAERRRGAKIDSPGPFWVTWNLGAPIIIVAVGCMVLANVAMHLLLGAEPAWWRPLVPLAFVMAGVLLANRHRGDPKRLQQGRCADCGYDLRSVAPDAALVAAGVDAGPARCPECGTRLPLVPSASGREVLWWDKRTRGLV